MNTKLEQAARQALETLQAYERPVKKFGLEFGLGYAAITALREALEEVPKTAALEQESAWIANDWSVFNTGAEVANGLSLNDAMDYLTDERAARGWSVVCVINKDNMPTPAAPQPARQPLTQEQEPVAYLYCGGQFGGELDEWEICPQQFQCDKLNEHFGALGKEARIPLYTAPQPARQPLTQEQVWENDEIMEVNADVGLVMGDLMRLVRAIERAHGIGGNHG